MTSQVDSAAYFSQRAAEVSLTTRVTTALQDAGLKTLSQLAFCVGQPGQLLPQTDFDNWTNSLLQNMTIGEKAPYRRLGEKVLLLCLMLNFSLGGKKSFEPTFEKVSYIRKTKLFFKPLHAFTDS